MFAESETQEGLSEYGISNSPVKVYIWLLDQGSVTGSTVTCFQSNLFLKQSENVLLTTAAYGPIGVKEVVDALGYAVDDSCFLSLGSSWELARLRVEPSEVLHIVWEPSVPRYTFHILEKVAGESILCGDQISFPNFKVPPVLRMESTLGACRRVYLERMGSTSSGSGDVIQIKVPSSCL